MNCSGRCSTTSGAFLFGGRHDPIPFIFDTEKHDARHVLPLLRQRIPAGRILKNAHPPGSEGILEW